MFKIKSFEKVAKAQIKLLKKILCQNRSEIAFWGRLEGQKSKAALFVNESQIFPKATNFPKLFIF